VGHFPSSLVLEEHRHALFEALASVLKERALQDLALVGQLTSPQVRVNVADIRLDIIGPFFRGIQWKCYAV